MKGGEIGHSSSPSLGVTQRGLTTDGRNHQIFAGVLGRNKLEDPGLVTSPLEQQGPQRVRREFCMTLPKNSVTQRAGQRRRHRQLGPNLTMAARRDQQQRRFRLHPLGQRLVGRGVAGVQGHHYRSGLKTT